jgi:hypothetical protein
MTTAATSAEQVSATHGTPDKRWLFSFGEDHRLRIGSAENPYGSGTGMSLRGKYVILLAATADQARARFLHLFGPAFAHQYDLDAGSTAELIARYGMEELKLPW